MGLSSFLIRVIFIALPGILATKLYYKFRGKPKRKEWEDILEIVIFSLLSYAVYASIAEALNAIFAFNWPRPLQALFDEKIPIDWGEIVRVSAIGLFLAWLCGYAHRFKCIHKLGQLVGVTNRFGDEDVWELFHNLSGTSGWIFVRDNRLDLVYFGWILAFSESGKERELVMRDVQVFRNVGVDDKPGFLYETDTLYLARDRNELTIEIPMTRNAT